MPELVPPHGSGAIRPLLVPEIERAEELECAASLPKISLTSREVSDVFMFGMGAYTPLAGFMGRSRLERCLQRYEACRWNLLANSDYALGQQGNG